jgi:hypothetical protein
LARTSRGFGGITSGSSSSGFFFLGGSFFFGDSFFSSTKFAGAKKYLKLFNRKQKG